MNFSAYIMNNHVYTNLTGMDYIRQTLLTFPKSNNSQKSQHLQLK